MYMRFGYNWTISWDAWWTLLLFITDKHVNTKIRPPEYLVFRQSLNMQQEGEGCSVLHWFISWTLDPSLGNYAIQFLTSCRETTFIFQSIRALSSSLLHRSGVDRRTWICRSKGGAGSSRSGGRTSNKHQESREYGRDWSAELTLHLLESSDGGGRNPATVSVAVSNPLDPQEF
jgi:hypothetical protein